ncbi:MAG: hypothetical protein AVDCRST_MAG11-388, partial [uncultured Gemmatimonadaceae bacterium]
GRPCCSAASTLRQVAREVAQRFDRGARGARRGAPRRSAGRTHRSTSSSGGRPPCGV